MKIRLIENAISYSKVRKNVESIILPAISELGFTFSPYRTTNINAYETVYNGNYTDLNIYWIVMFIEQLLHAFVNFL